MSESTQQPDEITDGFAELNPFQQFILIFRKRGFIGTQIDKATQDPQTE